MEPLASRLGMEQRQVSNHWCGRKGRAAQLSVRNIGALGGVQIPCPAMAATAMGPITHGDNRYLFAQVGFHSGKGQNTIIVFR